jgi:uncharacterized membrane protein
MAPDVSDLTGTIGSALGRVAREATQAASDDGSSRRHGTKRDGPLSGIRGVVVGAALAVATPIAAIRAGSALRKAVAKKTEQAEDAPDAMKEGRRMPVQQAVDVAVPLAVAYNQWTQFEDWPQFIHRFTQVTQEDDCTVSLKLRGMSKELVAQIVEQRPDERIQWTVEEGGTHAGVVTFHELAPRLTRVQVSLDVERGSLLEQAARGMRLVERAVRADLARFKAFIELREMETGAWRGRIHDGELLEEHDARYDRGREYRRQRANRGASARQAGRSDGQHASGSGSSRRGAGSSRQRG